MNLGAVIKRLNSKNDAELEREIEKLSQERRAYARSMEPFRDDAHAVIGRIVAEARATFSAKVGQYRHQIPGVHNQLMEQLVRLFVAGSPEFEKALRASIDGAPDALFATETKAAFEKKLSGYDAQIAERELELQRRAKAARAEAAARELEEFQKAVA